MDPEEQTSDLYGIIQSVVHVEWLSTALTVAIALAFTALDEGAAPCALT